MEATLHVTGKKAMKVLGAACLATGVVALSAVAASGAAVGAVMEGFYSAKKTMQKVLKREDALATDEVLAESPGEVLTKSMDEAVAAEERGGTATAEEVSADSADIDGVVKDEL